VSKERIKRYRRSVQVIQNAFKFVESREHFTDDNIYASDDERKKLIDVFGEKFAD